MDTLLILGMAAWFALGALVSMVAALVVAARRAALAYVPIVGPVDESPDFEFMVDELGPPPAPVHRPVSYYFQRPVVPR